MFAASCERSADYEIGIVVPLAAISPWVIQVAETAVGEFGGSIREANIGGRFVPIS